ncbi:MAG: N-acetylmuramoyl-L-alanine amidase [Urechidicola sp.]|jgi:N-acetylmuramoyl-L-alanine amidase
MNMYLNCIMLNLFYSKLITCNKVNVKTMFLEKMNRFTLRFMTKRFNGVFLVVALVFFQVNSFSQLSRFKNVVIDAGHGGHDDGCSGTGSKEKVIALNIALKLGKLIEAGNKDVTVIYTRKSDKFVTLDNRAKIANTKKADLFICIHANANTKSSPSGTETYVLGLHKTKEQKEIAARENAVIELEENSSSKYQKITPERLIARTMQLSAYLNQSISFASQIQKEFKKIGRKDRGVKQAGFVVLYKTTMPSVLIETGFLTNAAENTYLKKSVNQQKMAQAIYNAFKRHKSNRDKIYNEIYKNKSDVKPSVKTTTSNSSEVVFKIQLASSTNKIEPKSYNFKGLRGVELKKDGKYYRYYYGMTSSHSSIKKSLERAKTKGYKDAFVMGFVDGKRVDLQKAIKLENN